MSSIGISFKRIVSTLVSLPSLIRLAQAWQELLDTVRQHCVTTTTQPLQRSQKFRNWSPHLAHIQLRQHEQGKPLNCGCSIRCVESNKLSPARAEIMHAV